MTKIRFKLVKKVIMCLCLGVTFSGFSQIGIGTAEPSIQSSLDIRATDKGLLIPRLTTAQRITLGTTLTTAANSNNKGMQVFDTDLNLNWFWNGTAWKKNSAILEWLLTGVYETGDVIKKEGVLYEANGNVPTNTTFTTGTSGATWKIISKTSLTAHNITGSNLSSGDLVFIDPQYGVYENPARLLYGETSSYFASPKRVGTLQGDVSLNIGVNQPFDFFDKGVAIIRGIGDFTDNTGTMRSFIQGEEIWYRPFEVEKYSNNKGTLGNAIRLGIRSSNSGSSAGLGINFDPVFVYKQNDEVNSSYKPILNHNATLPGATRVGRSIVGTTGLSGVFVGKANNYVDYDGANFIFTAPSSGERVLLVDNVANIGQAYEFSGTAWNFLSKITPLATDNYNVSKNYQQNDLVIRNNKIYQANDYVAGGTAFSIGTTGATWKRISEIPNWELSAVYETGDVVKRSGILYEANGNIVTNTAFAVGTTGATWTMLNSSVAGDWISAGTVQAVGIAGTTAAPTVPTNVYQNRINYRRVGPKTYEVKGVLNYGNNAGGSDGNGDYLFTLPAGLQFDLSIQTQAQNQLNIGSNSNHHLANGIPGSSFMLVSDGLSTSNIVGVVPWDATRYRLIIWNPGSSIRAWGSGNYQLMYNTDRYASWSFTFQTP